MKRAYPVVFKPIQDGYMVTVPDLDIDTHGKTIAEAISMARDAIGIWGICKQDDGYLIPEPSIDAPMHEINEFVSWVDIDFDAYRQSIDATAERTNVSIPRNLKRKAEAAGISFSQELQTRLKEVLHG